MTKASSSADPKRTFEASAFTAPATRLRSTQRRSHGETEPFAGGEADARPAEQHLPALEVKPSVVLRLIQLFKEL